MALTAKEFEGKTVRSLKTLVFKQIGVSRFRQRWLSENHTELLDDEFVTASDVQLVVLPFVQSEDEEIKELYRELYFAIERLFLAIERNDSDRVEELLRKTLNPDAVGGVVRVTALQLAAEEGHWEVVKLLLEAGAYDWSANGYTALDSASANGHSEVVSLLLEARDDNDRYGADQALCLAAQNGHLEIVQLLSASANVNVFHFTQASRSAAKNRHWEVVKFLLEAEVHIYAVVYDGQTALHLAAMEGHPEVVKLLLEEGADKDAATGLFGGQKALHLAAVHGRSEVVKLLLEAGADKDAVDLQGKTALDLAIERRHLEVVRLLEVDAESYCVLS